MTGELVHVGASSAYAKRRSVEFAQRTPSEEP